MRNILYIVAALVFMGCTWNADNVNPTKSVLVGLENDTTIAAVDSAATVDTDTVRYPIGLEVEAEDWKTKKK